MVGLDIAEDCIFGQDTGYLEANDCTHGVWTHVWGGYAPREPKTVQDCSVFHHFGPGTVLS